MRAGGCGQAAFHCWRTSRGVRPWTERQTITDQLGGELDRHMVVTDPHDGITIAAAIL